MIDSLKGRRRTRRDHRLAVTPLEGRVLATVGLPDPTFQAGSSLVLPVPAAVPTAAPAPRVVDAYPLPDGKTLLVATSNELTTLAAGGVLYSPLLVRLNPDGSPDASFGSGGQVVGAMSGGFADDFLVTDSALQPDGKILLAGQSGRIPVSGAPRLTVQRVNPDGTLDRTFSYDGPSVGFSDGEGAGVAVTPSGKIYVATSVSDPATPSLFLPAVLRLDPDGSPDPTFQPASGGRLILDLPFDSPERFGFDDELAAQGESLVVVTNVGEVRVQRVDAAGALDPSFGTAGAATFTNSDLTPGVLAIDGQGHILLAGQATRGDASRTYFAVARLDASGHPDASFNGGLTTVGFEPRFAEAGSIAVAPDGKILVAGIASAPDLRSVLAIARLNPDGTPDAAYGSGGHAVGGAEVFPSEVLVFDASLRLLTARIGRDEARNGVAVVQRLLTSDLAIDATPPTVTGIATTFAQGRVLKVRLIFSEPMDAASAGSTGSYQLLRAGRDGRFGTRDDVAVRITSATYDPASRTASLRLRRAARLRPALRLVARGAAITDASGNRLAGGVDFIARIGRTTR